MMMLAFLLCMGGMLCAHARHRAPPPSRCAPSLCMDLHQWRAARSRAGRLRQLNPARAALHLAQCGSGLPSEVGSLHARAAPASEGRLHTVTPGCCLHVGRRARMAWEMRDVGDARREMAMP